MNVWYETVSNVLLNLDKVESIHKKSTGDSYAITDGGDKVELSEGDYVEISDILFGMEK